MNFKEQYWKYSLIALILGIGAILFIKFIPFLSGILGASTIYILVRRQMFYLTGKRRIRRSFVALLMLAEAALCFLIPISLGIWLFINKLQDVNLDPQAFIHFAEHLADLIHEKTGYNVLDKTNIMSVVSALPRLGQWLMGGIGSFSVNVFVLLFVLYFMLIGGRQMERYVFELLPFNEKNKRKVLREINMIVKSNAIGIPLQALIQGMIAMTGYYIFSTPSPLLFGFFTCLATVIPIVGTALVWVPLVIYLAFVGDWVQAAGLLVYAVAIITNVDNLIRFVLQKQMADIHPLVTIFGVVIGLSLFGFMGIIFGPLLLSVYILCIRIFKDEYLEK